jgi:hypothetical protein
MPEPAIADPPAPPAPTPGSLLGNPPADPPPADPPADPPPSPPAPPEGGVLSGLFDDKLTFKENWLQGLAKTLDQNNPLAAELMGTKVFDAYKDLPNLLKGTIEAKKLVGADKIAKPGPESSQEVWDAFYRAGGKPETAQGYKLEFPQGQELSKERMEFVTNWAHKNHLSNTQLQELVNFRNAENEQAMKDADQAIQDEMVATTNGLNEKWGGAYDAKLRKVSAFFNNLGLGEIMEKSGMGRNLEFILAFESQVIDKLSEDSSLLGADEPLAPQDIEAQIQDALKNPESPYNRKVPGASKALEELYKQRAIMRRKKS